MTTILRSLILERDQQRQRAEQESKRAQDLQTESLRQRKRADELHLENLRLQLELQRYKKWRYGPRADRLTHEELAQALLEFGEQLQSKPIHPEDVPGKGEPEYELRRVKRRPGRRHLANFENLPVTTQVYELSAQERSCPCCGTERKEIGADESWQIEYIPGGFERLHHIRKKYACLGCERVGENPQMEVAAKPEAAIAKGMAGPGLLAYIVTSKFSDYLPLYRLEDIFERQGFEISRATQSIWCGDVADLVEPLYELMGERVRQSHVMATDDTIMPMQSVGKAKSTRMWVYVGDAAHPYNVFDFTLNRGRDGPKYFLQGYPHVLLADGYGGYDGVVAGNQITRAGCWAHARRKIIDAEKVAPEIAHEAVELIGALFRVESQAKDFSVEQRLAWRREKSAPVLAKLREKLLGWKEQLLPKHPMAEAINYTVNQWAELNVFCSDGAVPLDNNIVTAARGSDEVMPTPGLCRAAVMRSYCLRRFSDFRGSFGRHNHRLSKKASNGSGGRKRSGVRPDELAWA
ncbi:MAG TPA: IS66 family transposase, partial [Candidatus Sulfotelmatobacter sp.]|nr:IS66 family transposase [Candidatus Sulfotelmatobacter sp.]